MREVHVRADQAERVVHVVVRPPNLQCAESVLPGVEQVGQAVERAVPDDDVAQHCRVQAGPGFFRAFGLHDLFKLRAAQVLIDQQPRTVRKNQSLAN